MTLERIPGTLNYTCEGGRRTTHFTPEGRPQPLAKNELPLDAVYDFKIQNLLDEPLYVAVILLSSTGDISVVYPIASRTDPVDKKVPALTKEKVTVQPPGKMS